MVEKITENLEKSDISKLESAKNNIRSKTLWMVPNWECNRFSNPCRICFATDIMQDAKANGYVHANSDYFAKTKILSALPWTEVVITGGEPTTNKKLLRNTISSIDPKREIRIITNGDWILKEKSKEEILALISSFNRHIQIDISAHDEWKILQKKIDALVDKLPFGIQSRIEEDIEPSEEKNYNIDLFSSVFFNVEEHRVIRLGKPKSKKFGTGYVLLDLKKLISYSKEKNQGIYLISGKGGTRIIANHETPYFVNPTPADIAKTEDTPKQVYEKVLDFYSKIPEKYKGELNPETIEYAKAAFKAKAPCDILHVLGNRDYAYSPEIAKSGTGYTHLNVNHKLENYETSQSKSTYIDKHNKLMNCYYETISEISGMPIKQIKDLIVNKIVERIIDMDKHYQTRYYYVKEFEHYLPLTYDVAINVPQTPFALAKNISRELLPCERDTRLDGKTSMFKGAFRDPFDAFMGELDYPDQDSLNNHLKILGINGKDIAEKLKQLTGINNI